jgi:site-specific DNA recombinase
LPREQWIEIPVPALIDEHTFALAQERLANNKKLAARRTIEPSILQGLVHCRHCGYALYRTSTRSSARKIPYYRCLGSDAWRYEGKARCDQRPIRLDLLEHTVWTQLVRLLEDPALIQVERLLTAYQEELLSLDELRRRMPELRRRAQSLQIELASLRAQVVDQAAYLRLAQTLSSFLENLRSNVQTLDIRDRQRIARLLVKEVVVGNDSITIRHSIPPALRSAGGDQGSSNLAGSAKGTTSGTNYLLCPWTDYPTLRCAAPVAFTSPYTCRLPAVVLAHDGGFQPLLDEG